ncbi:amino acid adenylation domain-containing protein [Pseudomonas sp. MYb118]|uniref:amino acid adenylation domain-containing protein n=1 Tax=Pseudomonas sp. MYb118 TaxID=1848720 RepID=UPI0034CDE182
MNPLSMDQQDLGYALTPEQQQVLAQLPKASLCGDALHFFEVDVNGALDPQRLQTALDALLVQQPMLLAQVGKAAGFHGFRQFAAQVERFPLTVQARIESAADIQAQIAEWAARSYVLGESESVQAVLYRLADEQWKLVFGVARHCCDDSGLKVLYQQLCLAYEQSLPEGDDAPGEFSQYLEWRSEVVLDEDAAGARLYWQEHLQDADVELSSPWLAYRKASAESSSALFSSALEPALLAGLQQASAALQQPQSLLLQGAWWLLLARLSGQEQMLVGVRHDSREDYEYFADAVGVFARNLPLNLALPLAAPFDGWLAELAARLDEHRTWQEYWAPELAPKAALPACGFAAWRAPRAETAGLHWLPSIFPLALGEVELLMQAELDDGGAAQALHLHFAASRYSVQAIEGLVGQFKVLLGAIVANPRAPLGQLSLLGADEQQRLLAINPAPSVVEARYLPQRIAEHARSNPDAIALTDATQRLSYGQLQAQVTTLAQALRAQGLGRGAIVALALPRSVDLVVAMLAAWQVGAAYLPLDPQWPQARQALMVEQAGAELLLVDDPQLQQWQGSGVRVSTLTPLFNAASVLAIEPAVELQTQGDDVAYVLFTSGSTGQPKGVVIEHRQLLNYTAQVSQALGLEQCRQVGLTSTVAADLGNTALFGALFNGATLHVASDEQMQDASRFAAFVQQQAIDCLKIVPSHLAALLDGEQARVPRTLVLGGEPIAPTLLTRIAHLRSDCRVFNHYGPTEATVGVLVHPLDTSSTDTGALSQVLGNNQVFVLDEALQLAPVGVLGELYLGGAQLCRGYLNAEADAQAFIQSPFDATQRLYRTGDLARYRPDLSIQLHGRRDQQIKVRGFRIELAEVEAELLRLPNVAQALVLPGATAQEGMLAFVVAGEAPVSGWLDDLRSALALRLPSVMLPQQIQAVERFPRLANGKIDRQALQQLGATSVDDAGLEPRDALEQLLATRMAQLLDLPRLGIDRDFFAAGGHSLLVIKLVAGIRKLLQCEIQPGLVFDHPTVAGLAQALRASESVPGQLEKIAQARLRLDSMSPEEKALLARQLQEAKAL